MKLTHSHEALNLLIEGNKRFVSGLRSLETVFSVAKMKELAQNGQSPFAIVLTCSDSRVPTEMVFDRGLGDLFVVRVAGNITSPEVIASIEFAALNFKSPLCVVMGHSGCGAVKAALDVESGHGLNLTASLEQLVREIKPSAKFALQKNSPNFKDTLKHATHFNVKRSASSLIEKSPVLHNLIQEQKFMITGAIYDIESGLVSFDSEGLSSDSSLLNPTSNTNVI